MASAWTAVRERQVQPAAADESQIKVWLCSFVAVSLTSFLRNGVKTATDPKDAGQSFIIPFKVLKPFLWVVFRFFLLERQSKMASVWPAESFRFVLGSAYNAFLVWKILVWPQILSSFWENGARAGENWAFYLRFSGGFRDSNSQMTQIVRQIWRKYDLCLTKSCIFLCNVFWKQFVETNRPFRRYGGHFEFRSFK